MKRFPFDRAVVLKAAMEPLSESKRKDFLGCCWGKHARDKPFPRNPPRKTPKRNLNQSVLKRCQKASEESTLCAAGRNIPERSPFPKPTKKDAQKKPKPECFETVRGLFTRKRCQKASERMRKAFLECCWAKQARANAFPSQRRAATKPCQSEALQ